MTALIPIVHKSDIYTVKQCKRELYYQAMKAPRMHMHHAAAGGTAINDVINEMHNPAYTLGFNLDDAAHRFLELYNGNQEKLIQQEIDIKTPKDPGVERYIKMLQGYIGKEYNRTAIPILMEKSFYFEIKRGRARYPFAGTIDHLFRFRVADLIAGGVEVESDQEWIYIHRDIKSGTTRDLSRIKMEYNADIMVYAYALRYGKFNLRDPGICDWLVNHIPAYHGLYYLQDHMPYVKSGKWGPAGSDRGPGMHLVQRPQSMMKAIENELVSLWKEINDGNKSRTAVGDRCDQVCPYRDICLEEFQKGE